MLVSHDMYHSPTAQDGNSNVEPPEAPDGVQERRLPESILFIKKRNGDIEECRNAHREAAEIQALHWVPHHDEPDVGENDIANDAGYHDDNEEYEVEKEEEGAEGVHCGGSVPVWEFLE